MRTLSPLKLRIRLFLWGVKREPLSSTNNSSVGEGLSLSEERFRGIGDCRAGKPKPKKGWVRSSRALGSLGKGTEG